jgi:hypothetical protein
MIWHLYSRNKRKQGRNDDSPTSLKIMDNVMFANGLECKISCESSKVRTILLDNVMFAYFIKATNTLRFDMGHQYQYLFF